MTIEVETDGKAEGRHIILNIKDLVNFCVWCCGMDGNSAFQVFENISGDLSGELSYRTFADFLLFCQCFTRNVINISIVYVDMFTGALNVCILLAHFLICYLCRIITNNFAQIVCVAEIGSINFHFVLLKLKTWLFLKCLIGLVRSGPFSLPS